MSDGAIRVIRTAAVSIGGLLLLVALLANVLGLSTGAGLSRNQITFGVTGLVLISAGLLGRKFPGFYRGTAVMLLNIIIAVILLDLMALVMVKMFDPERFALRARKLDIEHADVMESTVVQGMYAPFVVWRTNAILSCDTLSITEDGYRLTPGTSQDIDAYRVFLFGGSSMWGYGVSDSCTIGAYLQRDLEELTGQPVAVLNLGQLGYASTQEMIELILQLRAGNVPDLVVFYDGVNDAWNAFGSGNVGGHHSEDQVSARVEGRSEEFEIPSVPETLLRNSNIWLLMTSINNRSSDGEIDIEDLATYSTMGIDRDTLASAVVSTYLGNCAVVEALAESYDFEYLFVWQPCIWLGEKPLTTDEENLYLGGVEYHFNSADQAYRELLESTYRCYAASLPDTNHYATFTGIFRGVTEEIYTDFSGVHLSATGNEIVAANILDLIVGQDILQGPIVSEEEISPLL